MVIDIGKIAPAVISFLGFCFVIWLFVAGSKDSHKNSGNSSNNNSNSNSNTNG